MEQPVRTVQPLAVEKSSRAGDLQRLLSLDVFRGITICLMIIVNTPGKGAPFYPYLVHAKWFGFTLADLVFPSFLFAVGNAMSLSAKKFELVNEGAFLRKVVKRALLIFLIGYLMYWFPFVRHLPDGSWAFKPIGETRIMGVLQRIALCYLFTALLTRYLSQRATMVVAAVLLLVYWVILYLFGDAVLPLSMEGNAITRLDLFLLGEGHVYKKDAMPFDPEGILSTLPAIINVLAGYWVGVFLQKQRSYERLAQLMVAGCLLVTLALWWNLVFPISKKLWTSSFVLYTIGIDVLVLSVLVYWVELRKQNFAVNFFTVLGKNPLFIYLLSELLYIVLMLITVPSGQSAFAWVSINIFQNLMPGAAGALATAVVFMMICWGVGCWLDKKKIYIRI